MEPPTRLRRALGLGDAVALGVASMIGAGAFVAIPAADEVARPWLLWALGVAAFVALCNGLSSAQLAAVHPESGGTYAYARHRLGTVWGVTAGWAFVAGKIASCAAIARTIALYGLPSRSAVVTGVVAAGVTVALAALDYRGVRKTASATAVFAVVAVGSLLVVVANVLELPIPLSEVSDRPGTEQFRAILAGAAILFFAFAGYARIATLGEEVREPARTIPQAILISVFLVATVYALVAATWLSYLSHPRILIGFDLDSPLAGLVRHFGRWPSTAWIVRVGAVVAGLGVLLSLMAGIARTLFAAAHNGDAPRGLGAVHPQYRVPHVATIAVGTVVAVLAAVADVRDAIAFSAFTVLVYYAITNASALRLRADERRWPPIVAWLGLAGCLALAGTLLARAVVPGAAVVAVGLIAGSVRAARRGGAHPPQDPAPPR